jgi:hypothetical protein
VLTRLDAAFFHVAEATDGLLIKREGPHAASPDGRDWEAALSVPSDSLRHRVNRALAGLVGLVIWAVIIGAPPYVVLRLAGALPLDLLRGGLSSISIPDWSSILTVTLLLAISSRVVWDFYQGIGGLADDLIRHSEFFSGAGLIKSVFKRDWFAADHPEPARWKSWIESSSFGSYAEYLQSDQWQAKRQLMLQRTGNRCQLCSGRNRVAPTDWKSTTPPLPASSTSTRTTSSYSVTHTTGGSTISRAASGLERSRVDQRAPNNAGSYAHGPRDASRSLLVPPGAAWAVSGPLAASCVVISARRRSTSVTRRAHGR